LIVPEMVCVVWSVVPPVLLIVSVGGGPTMVSVSGDEISLELPSGSVAVAVNV
jgi:hypothetical protein